MPDPSSPSLALRFDSQTFASEIIEDELIVMNLRDGTYYCVRGSIAAIWPLLISGVSLEAALARALGRVEGEPEAIRADILQVVGQLADDGIVVPEQPWTVDNGAAEPGTRVAFRPMTFEKYTDMQDLLTLDPIHDVDTTEGWPKPQP
jgi:hypothetical protein